MEDLRIINLLRTLEIGTEIELTIKCLGGTAKTQGKYKGGLEHHGYYTPSGGWGCSSLKGKYKGFVDERECWQFHFTQKGKRSMYIMQIGYKVLDIKVLN